MSLHDRIHTDHSGRLPHRPAEALDLSVRLLRFYDGANPDGNTVIDASSRLPAALPGDSTDPTSFGFGNTDGVRAYGELILRRTLLEACGGMTQYVTPEIVHLVTSIAEEMPPEPLFPTDIQFPAGLIVLGSPLAIPWHDMDADGHLLADGVSWLNTHAIAYAPIDPTIEVLDEDREAYDEALSLLLLSHQDDVTAWMNRYRPGQEPFDIDPGFPLGRAPMVISDQHAWAIGRTWDAAGIGDTVTSSRTAPKVGWVRRWLLAYWRLLWQEILDPEPFHLDRAFRRRLQRVRPIPDSGDVLRVIRMRKVYDERDFIPGDREPTELAHGHWRRAHWRRIHRDTIDERLVWVKGHWVRPDLPVAESWKVVSVER
jgi:hypothetical protein